MNTIKKSVLIFILSIFIPGLISTARGFNGQAGERAPIPKLGSLNQWVGPSIERSSKDYQLGDEWGKKPVDTVRMAHSPIYKRAVLATASMGGATGFYLGKFAGHHVIATNHHVCPSFWACGMMRIHFPLLKIQVKSVALLGTWSEIDLALLEVSINSVADEQALANVAANFDFSSPIYPEQLLMTAGFGVANNDEGELMVNEDSDCKVFSDVNEFHLMADPDAVNPGDYSAWSFSNGCDISHGDSGSAMVDRQTGHPLGIIWTGKIPKSTKVQNTSYLADMLKKKSPEIWTELSYSVPARKMYEFLTQLLSSGQLSGQTKAILQVLLKGEKDPAAYFIQ